MTGGNLKLGFNQRSMNCHSYTGKLAPGNEERVPKGH